jgi:hypothetical protein
MSVYSPIGDLAGAGGGADPAEDTALRNLVSAGRQLEVELLRAQGRELEAVARQREIETEGLSDQARAQYDLNAAVREQIAELQRAAQVAQERADLERQLLTLQGDTAAIREAELAALDPSNRALQERIWALQDLASAEQEAARLAAEQAAQAAAVANERAALERRLLELSGDTAAIRALELAALDESNRALQERIWALEDEAAAAAEAAAQAAAIASERLGLERQLLELQGDTAALRALELAALDETNRALQLQIWALQDAAAAQRAAEQAAREAEAAERQLAAERERLAAEQAAAMQRIADERYGLETRLLQLQGDTAELRARELAQLDPSNRALQERIYALEDEARAAERAASVTAERQSLERRLLELTGDTAAIRAMELAALDESNRDLQRRIWALEDEAKAAEEAARAADELRRNWEGASKAIVDEVERIRGTIDGSGSFASAQRDFALATAAARAGDLEAARRLPQLSQDLLRLAEGQVGTVADLRRIQARTAASLEDTANVIGDEFAGPVAPPAIVSGLDKLHTDNNTHTAELQQMRASMTALYNLMRRVTRDGDALVTTTE